MIGNLWNRKHKRPINICKKRPNNIRNVSRYIKTTEMWVHTHKICESKYKDKAKCGQGRGQ